MLVLALDTSAALCELALVRDGAVLGHHEEALTRGHEAVLAGRTRELMAAAGIGLAELDRIGVVTGPGSFTGTRIAVAFARGLALSLKRPAVGVTSLMAALPEAAQTGAALALLPAQRREPELTWWGQVFHDGQVRSQPFEMDEIVIGETFGEWPGALVAEAGARPPQRLAGRAVLAPETSRAVNAARWAGRLDPAVFVSAPAYVRPPDAVPLAARPRSLA